MALCRSKSGCLNKAKALCRLQRTRLAVNLAHNMRTTFAHNRHMHHKTFRQYMYIYIYIYIYILTPCLVALISTQQTSAFQFRNLFDGVFDPKTAQDGPKMGPRCSKPPKGSSRPHKMAPRWLQDTPRGPPRSPKNPKTGRHGPKTARSHPRRPQDRPKKHPRGA